MTAERLTFHGPTYAYPTPRHGLRQAGVLKGLGSLYIVGWISRYGGIHRIKTPNLPALNDPEALQALLENYAEIRHLQPCMEHPTCATCSKGPERCMATPLDFCGSWVQRAIKASDLET